MHGCEIFPWPKCLWRPSPHVAHVSGESGHAFQVLQVASQLPHGIFLMIWVVFKCALQLFQVTVQVPNGVFQVIWVVSKCAFQVLQVAVQMPNGIAQRTEF